MAYFECTIGGASGDGVALIVQCDANFAGSTITADNGEDVFTEICPSVSPYTVRFEGIPTGTYTISGVAQGQTFTTQFTVLDYETTLNATPEGATVLPVNDIQIWLNCANIWDKNYTTISQVLADTTTLLTLVSSNNAADYMARSTSWASSVCANQTAMGYIGNNDYCANTLIADATWLAAICNSAYMESVLNVKVPTMTSNTTPSGECFGSQPSSNDLSAFGAFNAFGGSSSYGFMSEIPPVHLGYTFTNAVRVCVIDITNLTNIGGEQPTKIIVRATNDAITTDQYGTMTNTPSWTVLKEQNISSLQNKIIVSNATSYKSYDLVLSEIVKRIQVKPCQFYGRA